MKTEQKIRLLAVTKMEAIDFISEGIESSVSGHVISEDGLTNIAEALEAGEAAQARITELEEQVTTAQTAQHTAEANLATANETINANNTRIQDLEARVTELEEEPGIQHSSREKDGEHDGKVPFHQSKKSSFNQLADELFAGRK